MNVKLHRSRQNRVIAGIFGGLGELYGVDPNILRIIYVLFTIMSGIMPGVLLYAIAWAIIPEKTTVIESGTPPVP